ncbi:MAG: leucine-rich repeat domain-containing protein [Firmicutes bacterium]|nr:leucine-rich repeat domain-containing protein [Bacillota bacterium]
MKKLWSLIVAAAMLASSAGAVLAEDSESYADEETQIEEVWSEEAEEEAYEEAVSIDDIGGNVELFSTVDGVTFEYDSSASTTTTRVVKVLYNSSYFTTGISGFEVQISVPTAYVTDISYTTNLSSSFTLSDSYSGGVYTVTGTCGSNKVPSDGALFTMTMTLAENETETFDISLTGDTYLSDTSTTVSLSNGMNSASLSITGWTQSGSGNTDGAITWTFANHVLTIYGDGTMSAYTAGTAPWYQYKDDITSIVFKQDNLYNIGAYAFYGLSNVTSVTFSDDIKTINDYAFAGCSALKSVTISNVVVGIGNYAFTGCSTLTSVTVPSSVKSIGSGAFYGCTGLTSITLPFVGSQVGSANNEDVFSYIFAGMVPSSLKSVTITNETKVPDNAFENCSSIQSITINNSVTDIGSYAFSGCSALKSFTIPSSVTEIKDYTFKNCTAITSISITDAITAIGEGAFYGCSSLNAIYVPEITVVNDYTFYGCSSLTSIEIPTTVTSIGESVLEGCTSLVNIKVPFVGASANPSSTAVTDEGIFGYFFGTTDNSTLPSSVTKVEVTGTSLTGYIPKEAFRNCSYIEDIIIDGGRSILDSAFKNCKNLKNLYLSKSISSIGDTILEDCTSLVTLTIPFVGISRSDKGTETSVLGGFFGYNDQDLNLTMQYYDGTNYHYYEVPTTLKYVTVLNQTDIPAGAFMECYTIEEITIVTGASMGEKAFYHCQSLKKVSLPDDLTEIGDEAFAECEALEEINIPTKVKTIGSKAFYNDRALSVVTMPDSITEIADDVFNGTGLYSLGDVSLMSVNTDITIRCIKDSYAYEYAVENGFNIELMSEEELEDTTLSGTLVKHSTGEYVLQAIDAHELSGTIYAAIYDANNKLLAVRVQTAASDTVDYMFTFTSEESANIDHAKVMIWNNMAPQTTTARTLTPEE